MKEFTKKEMKDLLVRFTRNIINNEGCFEPEEFVENFLIELKESEKQTSCTIIYECPILDRMFRCKHYKSRNNSSLCVHRCLRLCTCKEAQIEKIESELKELKELK